MRTARRALSRQILLRCDRDACKHERRASVRTRAAQGSIPARAVARAVCALSSACRFQVVFRCALRARARLRARSGHPANADPEGPSIARAPARLGAQPGGCRRTEAAPAAPLLRRLGRRANRPEVSLERVSTCSSADARSTADSDPFRPRLEKPRMRADWRGRGGRRRDGARPADRREEARTADRRHADERQPPESAAPLSEPRPKAGRRRREPISDGSGDGP